MSDEGKVTLPDVVHVLLNMLIQRYGYLHWLFCGACRDIEDQGRMVVEMEKTPHCERKHLFQAKGLWAPGGSWQGPDSEPGRLGH